ncbi:helix-turn-helix domain-containing protein [Methylophaga sp.]|uniref:helix-turn-helix domain-containing protein n=1 Tax=Methylophaga sp. TaxID=2024840 RepID=UPI003F6E9FA0
MRRKEALKALIDLSPVSMTQIAKHAGVNQANLSAWFTQNRYLSDEAITRVEEQLGVEADALSTDRVYVWRTGRDFSQLQLLLNQFFVKPKIIPVVKERAKRYELSDLLTQPMAIIVDEEGHRALVTLKTSTTKEIFKNAGSLPWFSPDYLPETSWLRPVEEDSIHPFPKPFQIKATEFLRWKKGAVSVADFNELLKSADAVSWQVLIDEATELVVGAADILGWLPLIRDAEIMSKSDILEWIERHIKQDAD